RHNGQGANMGRTVEHQLPLSEDERRLLQQLLYTELDAAEENVREFELNGPPRRLTTPRTMPPWSAGSTSASGTPSRPSRRGHDRGRNLRGHLPARAPPPED